MDHLMMLVVVSLCTARPGARALGVLAEYPYVFAAVPLHAPVPVLRVLTRARPAAAEARYGALADPLPHYAAETTRHYAADPHHYAAETTRHYAAEPPRHYAAEPPRHYAADPQNYAAEPTHQYAAESSPPYAVGPPLRHFAEPSARQYAAEPEAEAAQYSYARPAPVVLYARARPGAGGEGAVLYARLSPEGRYTYRRPPPAASASDALQRKVPAPAHNKEDPQYILKIHKHRIIKD